MSEPEDSELRQEEAEALARFQEELRRLTVGEHLTTMLQSIAALAVRKMGVGPETAGERDLAQAKLAIDAFRALLPVLEGSRPAHEIRAHRSVLSEIQMAYLGTLQQGQSGRSEGQDGGVAPDADGERGAGGA